MENKGGGEGQWSRLLNKWKQYSERMGREGMDGGMCSADSPRATEVFGSGREIACAAEGS